MKIREIEVLASKNAPMPDNMTPPETYLFLSLRAVYNGWRSGAVETSQAKREKSMVCTQFEELELLHRIYIEQSERLRCMQRYSDKIKNSGCPVCQGLFRTVSGLKK